MKVQKRLYWILFMPFFVICLIGIIIMMEPDKPGISRAMAAKSVALAVLPPEENDIRSWQSKQGESAFAAKELDEWYVPYLDFLYANGYLSEDSWKPTEDFLEESLTYEEANELAAVMSTSLAKSVRVRNGNRENAFPEDEWWSLYDSYIKEMDGETDLEKAVLRIYGTPKNVQSAPAWTAYTNRGDVNFSGLTLDRYIDHEIEGYVRGNELIHIILDNGTDITYSNVWITDASEKSIDVYQGGINRTIDVEKRIRKPEELIHAIADLDMEDGKVQKIDVKKDTITGKLLAVSDEGLEIEGYGLLPFDEEYQVLKTYGDVERQSLSDILVGYENEEFIVAKGKICAVLTVRPFDAKTIRVLLMTDGFTGIHHESVTLSWEGEVKQIQEDKEKTLSDSQPVTFTSGDGVFKNGRIILEPQGDGQIQVDSLRRALGTPSYGGRLEIVDTDQGLIIINDLYMEDYLKKVVPSEMPSSYEKEALKAQAVCARTYAYMQIQSNTYSQYGAHVDDSTNFQVYNNIATDEKTAQAVDETYGKMLFYEGNAISAFYFSTSCGTTTDTAIWGSDPAETPYLKAVTLQPSRRTLDISDNADFLAFIRRTDFQAYDSSFPYFRWNVTTNGSILSNHIEGVGTVTEMTVTNRSQSGVVQTLLVKGTEGETTISGQTAIRAALGDASLTINRNDGTTTDGWSSLPSGFLAIQPLESTGDGIARFRIYGGGYGHGVGMSQNGAQGMARQGMGYEEILTFFYDGVTVDELQ